MSSGHEHDDLNNLQPESSGVKPRPILVFLGILTVSTIIVFILIKVLLYAFDRIEATDKSQPATLVKVPNGRMLPPEPRLQGAPGPHGSSLLPLDEMKVYQKEIEEKAESYGWVDKTTGVAHIPIERAKEMIIEKGLPERSAAYTEEIQKAEAMRKKVLEAGSSGGRSLR